MVKTELSRFNYTNMNQIDLRFQNICVNSEKYNNLV